MRIIRDVTHHTGNNEPGGIRSDLYHLVNRILTTENLFCSGFRQDNFMRTVQQIARMSPFRTGIVKKLKKDESAATILSSVNVCFSYSTTVGPMIVHPEEVFDLRKLLWESRPHDSRSIGAV